MMQIEVMQQLQVPKLGFDTQNFSYAMYISKCVNLFFGVLSCHIVNKNAYLKESWDNC